MIDKKRNQLDYISKVLFIITLLLAFAYIARSILMPLFFSVFLSLILLPFCSWLERHKVKRILAIIIAMFTVLVIISSAFAAITLQVNEFAKELPQLGMKLEKAGNNIVQTIENYVELPGEESPVTFIKQNFSQFLKSGGKFFGDALLATSNVLTFIALVPIYVFLILLYRNTFMKVFKRVSPGKSGSESFHVISRVKEVVQGYMSGMSIVILIIAVLNSVGLYALGIKYAIFFGVVSAVLTIIPYIGIFIGASLPIIFALITKDSLWYPVGVAAVYGVVQFLEGNFLTPNIIGSKVNVNPLAAIISLIVGGKLWGITGMVLSIPMIAVIKITLEQFDNLKPFALLLESHEEGGTSFWEKSYQWVRKVLGKVYQWVKKQF